MVNNIDGVLSRFFLPEGRKTFSEWALSPDKTLNMDFFSILYTGVSRAEGPGGMPPSIIENFIFLLYNLKKVRRPPPPVLLPRDTPDYTYLNNRMLFKQYMNELEVEIIMMN